MVAREDMVCATVNAGLSSGEMEIMLVLYVVYILMPCDGRC